MTGRGVDAFGFGYRQLAGCCEQRNETAGTIKCEEGLQQLRNDQFFKKYSAAYLSHFFIYKETDVSKH
jgi:hypothetical protein